MVYLQQGKQVTGTWFTLQPVQSVFGSYDLGCLYCTCQQIHTHSPSDQAVMSRLYVHADKINLTKIQTESSIDTKPYFKHCVQTTTVSEQVKAYKPMTPMQEFY